MLGGLGQHEEALEAARESATLRRALAAEEPKVVSPALATALNAVAFNLERLGQHDESRAVAEEIARLRS